MKVTFATITMLAAMMMGAAAFAANRSYQFSASICHPDSNGSTVPYLFDQYGAHATDEDFGFGAFLFCPLPTTDTGTDGTAISIALEAYNRNPNDAVSCSVYRTDGSGNILYSVGIETVASSGTQFQAPTVFPPTGTGISGYWWALCYIPPPASAGFSHLVGIHIGAAE